MAYYRTDPGCAAPGRIEPYGAAPSDEPMTFQTQTLPQPDPRESQRCRRLAAWLKSRIAEAGGAIPFSRFMEAALYRPGLGFYAHGVSRFDAGGDFVTAPELGSVFGHCMANQCVEALDALGGGCVLEFGAGSGALCAQILERMRALNALPQAYLIVEVSPRLKALQQRNLAALDPELRRRITWPEALEEAAFEGVAIANEVLDALPVERYRAARGAPLRFDVAEGEDGFVWRETPVPGGAAERIVRRHGLAPGHVFEHHVAALAWARDVPRWLRRGVLLVVDYGYRGAEYYHPQRRHGVLRCHFRHHVHDDPLILVGLQDITAHLEFGVVAEAAAAAGLEIMGFVNQARFLLNAGLAECLDAPRDDVARRLSVANEIKYLTLPSRMGEVFKVLGVARGMRRRLSGFGDGGSARPRR